MPNNVNTEWIYEVSCVGIPTLTISEQLVSEGIPVILKDGLVTSFNMHIICMCIHTL